MIIYQEKQKTVNTGIEITDYEYLQGKAQDGLLQFSMSLGIEVMRMMLEEDVVQYAGPRESTIQLDGLVIVTELNSS